MSKGFQGKFMTASRGFLRGANGGPRWWTDDREQAPNDMQISRDRVRRRRQANKRARLSRRGNRS